VISDLETGDLITQEVTGRMDDSMCQCIPGTYLAGVNGSIGCLDCPYGAECLGGTVPPIALPGFGQMGPATARHLVTTITRFLSSSALDDPNEFTFYKCAGFDYCQKGDDSCDCIGGQIRSTATNMTSSTDGQSYYHEINTSRCGTGYVANTALCSHCETPDYAMTQGRCDKCTMPPVFYLIQSGILVPVIFYVINLVCNNFESMEIVRCE
jgi:hypothetical protein